MSPGFTPAPSRKVRFTGIMWQPPIGNSDERNGNPLMLPRTGTRARVPKTPGTSISGVIAATTPASLPSIFTLNRSFRFDIEPSGAVKLYPAQLHAARSPVAQCRQHIRIPNPTAHPALSLVWFPSPAPGSSWAPLPVRIAKARFTASGLTPFSSPPLKSPTPNTRPTCASRDQPLRRSGTTLISTIPNSPSPASPGSKPTTTVSGCRHTPVARTDSPRKPSGSVRLAAILNRCNTRGATSPRNRCRIMQPDGKPDPNPSPITLPTASAFTTSATTSTSGAATGTILVTTPHRPTAIPAAPNLPQESASAKPRAADRGAITSKSPAAPPAPASLPNSTMLITAFAWRATYSEFVALASRRLPRVPSRPRLGEPAMTWQHLQLGSWWISSQA